MSKTPIKGKKDCNAMLSPRLLELLRDWWWVGRPTTRLFPGQDPLLPITARQLYRVVREAAAAKKRLTTSDPTSSALPIDARWAGVNNIEHSSTRSVSRRLGMPSFVQRLYELQDVRHSASEFSLQLG